MRAAALAAAAGLAAAAAGAQDLRLTLPVDCRLGETCFIQQYPDRDPGPGWADFTCGPLSYDGHSGTDFALPSLAAMEEGVAVLAAAPGRVRGVRDGMPDIPAGAPGAPDIAGRECGNGVVLVHPGGWETQYCHMRSGSVRVAPGETVEAGAPLGLIGLSGDTAFPHLHLSVRRGGVDVDPFAPGAAACGDTPGPTLWIDPPPYVPGAIIAAGVATEVPAYDAVKAGLPGMAALGRDAPAVVLWVYMFGGRAGDVIRFTLEGPSGRILDETMAIDRPLAQFYRAAGLRRPAGSGWPAGAYSGEVSLVRDGASLSRAGIVFAVVP
jgi:hypothetical protein